MMTYWKKNLKISLFLIVKEKSIVKKNKTSYLLSGMHPIVSNLDVIVVNVTLIFFLLQSL